jgi:RNA polymerase-binding transcription factor DksA
MSAITPLATRKATLTARLADLQGRLASIEAELGEHNAQDWEDLATEREGDEVLEGMGTSGQQEIRAIEAALVRIDDGDYGFCQRCGGRIGEARLDVLPATPFCSSCAK